MNELRNAAHLYADRYFQNDLYENAETDFIAGATWAFQNRDTEKVVCAACKYVVNGQEVITLGYRHDQAVTSGDKYFWSDAIPAGQIQYLTHRQTEVQGFITTKNRFVDRREAAELAYFAGQIPNSKEELYSEDLY